MSPKSQIPLYLFNTISKKIIFSKGDFIYYTFNSIGIVILIH